MTTPSTQRKAGPLLGTGVQTAWPFTFKIFAEGDIAVTIANSTGAETPLVLGSDYSVALNSNQDTSPGGTVTYPISGAPLVLGSVLSIVGDLDYDQPLDLPGGGNFSPVALENELDRIVMQVQQLRETISRSILLPVTSAAVPSLPAPEANQLLGWDATGETLQNVPLSSLATAVAYGTFRYDTFTGDGVETEFPLTSDPAAIGNLDVAVDGLTMYPGADYLLVSSTLTFTVAPSNGAEILARYGQAIPSVMGADAAAISYQPGGVGSVVSDVETKLRESVSVKDFGAVGDGVADDTAAIQAAISSITSLGGSVFFPSGSYLISSTIVLPELHSIRLVGEGNGSQNTGYSATVIKKASTLSGEAIVINTDGSSIESMTVQGVAGNGGDGILVNASRCTLRDVSVFLMGNDGIRIGVDSPSTYNCNLWVLDNCKTKNNVRHGVMISEGAGLAADANGGTCFHLDTQSNGGDGLHLNGTQLCTYVGGAYQGNLGYGIRLTQYAAFNAFYGGDIEANALGQLRLDAGVEWNVVDNVTLQYSYISFGDPTDRNTIRVRDFMYVTSGITFPTTAYSASLPNTLDDYEEGTFTPAAYGTTLAGLGTYTTQTGKYTKIGNVVYFSIVVAWTAHTGTGDIRISGFPFPSGNYAGLVPNFSVVSVNLTYTNTLGAYILSNSAWIALATYQPGGASTPVVLDTAASVYVTGQYFV
jgi:hypothetical protein